MALSAQRAMLDSLMGLNRNASGDEAKLIRKTRWDDEGVCPYSLCGFCPHSLFTNTRSDLLECSYKHHDEDLRDEFRDLAPSKQYAVELRCLRHLESILGDLERKLSKIRQRIDYSAEDAAEEKAALERTQRAETYTRTLEQCTALRTQVSLDVLYIVFAFVD
jgi:hypothetical protein